MRRDLREGDSNPPGWEVRDLPSCSSPEAWGTDSLELRPVALVDQVDDSSRIHRLPDAEVELDFPPLLIRLRRVRALDFDHAPAGRLCGKPGTTEVLAEALYESGLR